MRHMFKATAILFVSCFLIGHVQANEVGVTAEKIKVGVMTPLTGPAAPVGRRISEGSEIAFRAANDDGGVHGRAFELIIEDNAYNPRETIAGFRKLVDRDRVFGIALCVGTPPGMAVIPQAERSKVPTILYSGPESFFNPPKRYVFIAGMPYHLEVIGLIEYAMKNLDAKNKKIGILAQSDLEEPPVSAMKNIAEKYGLKAHTVETFTRNAPDVSPQILSLIRADVDMIILACNTRDTALVLRKVIELNYNPVILGITPSADQSIFNALPSREGAEKVEFYAAASTAPIDMDIPGIKEMTDMGMKYYPNFEPNAYHVIGYMSAKLFIEAVKATGQNLTREKLIDTMERFQNVDMGGLMPPVTFGPERRFSGSSIRILKMDTLNQTFNTVQEHTEISLNPFK